MLGAPTDVYTTGTMYWWTVPALFIGVPIAAYVYLPIYHQLEIVSINQVCKNKNMNYNINSLINIDLLLVLGVTVQPYCKEGVLRSKLNTAREQSINMIENMKVI